MEHGNNFSLDRSGNLSHCLLCDSSPSCWDNLAEVDFYTESNVEKVTLSRCRICGLIFLKPFPNWGILLKSHFKIASYTTVEGYEKISFESERKPLFQVILSLAKDFQPQAGTLLDVGCGRGDFLEMAREDGWQVWGVEILERLSTECEKKGIPCFNAGSLQVLNRYKFNCITMIDSLYYMSDPLRELREAYRLLVSKGVLIIRVTNRNVPLRLLHFLYPSQMQKIGCVPPTQPG